MAVKNDIGHATYPTRQSRPPFRVGSDRYTDGVRFFRTLMLRFFARHRPDFPDAKLLADLYEETGDQFYYAALAHLILDKLEKQLWAPV